jgi:hypothetical protein
MSASGWCVRNVNGASFEHVGEAQSVGAKTGAPVGFVALLRVPALGHRRQLRVCAVERRRFPVGVRPTRRPLQPEATGAAMEVTK